MPQVTPHQLDLAQSTIGDIYANLEQTLFEMFVERLKAKGIADFDEAHILQWQMEKLNELHLVNEQTIKEVAMATNIAAPKLIELFKSAGYSIADAEYMRLNQMTDNNIQPTMVDSILSGYLKQTFLDLDNNVNQTLITTNYGENAAMRTYQQIIKETTAQVLSGLKTPDRALAETVYKWRDKGIQTILTDRGGHPWSLEGYARTVINTTSTRAFQAVRDQAADDFGIDTFVMSSHPASRPACAPIQGRLITTRRSGFKSEVSGEWFESLYDHEYKEPGGAFGINCRHIKWAYVPGVNTNNQPQYDPSEAIAKGDVVQKQRLLERRIRHYKHQADLADKLGDVRGKTHFDQLVRNNQSAMRKLVKDHDFLSRDYSREKVLVSKKPLKDEATAYQSRQYDHYAKRYGKHGLPSKTEFMRMNEANGRDIQLFHNYIDAREARSIEPISDFKLYKEIDEDLTKALRNIVTSDGVEIKSHAFHLIDRVIGTTYEQEKKVKRQGVSIDNIVNALQEGKVKEPPKSRTKKNEKSVVSVYNTSKASVRVNNVTGNVITVVPQ